MGAVEATQVHGPTQRVPRQAQRPRPSPLPPVTINTYGTQGRPDLGRDRGSPHPVRRRGPRYLARHRGGEDEGRFLPGTLLGGRYRILALLGRGGMGEVYRAMDLTLGQSVALKFLPEEACRNQRLLERFHGEVRVARLVSHPNVCRVYDIGEIEGMPFISMEYVDGEDLASLLTRIGRLPADKAVETAPQALRRPGRGPRSRRDPSRPQAAEHHDQQARRSGHHGFRTGRHRQRDLRGAEARNGTPAYMSPEQLKGAGVTARSDLYALGLVLYELFTGKRPFEAQIRPATASICRKPRISPA